MVDEKNLTVQIKGVREGLLITLGEGNWPDLESSLLNHIDERANFFKGAKIALEIGNQVLHAAEMGSLRDKLSERGVSLWAVTSNSSTTQQIAQVLGLATRLSAPRPERIVKPLDTNLTGESAVLVHRTLRSGFRLTNSGHIIVIGDVNPGAEIVAGGNIVVWGRLRGLVHAGADGKEKAVVCALDMMPIQLRIADLIAVSAQKKGKPQPEIARVMDGQVIVEIWNYKIEGGR
jgi:septum site-determining protein MinC